MLVLTSLWKQLLDCIANQSWKHQESLFRGCGKSEKLFECVCLKSGFSSICLLCCLKYCYFFKIYILLFLFPSAFFFRTPRSSSLCLIVSSSLTTSPSLWLSDPTHSIESQSKTMKILLKQWKVTLGSYNKIDSHHTILVLCVYFLWYLCFPSLNTLYCYTFLPFFSWLMLQITILPCTPWHQYPFCPYCSLYISQGANLNIVIISFILMTSMFDLGVIF